MGASYSDGLIDYVLDGSESLDEKVAFLTEFAELGLCPRFREVIGERVLELTNQHGRAEAHWLDEEAATVILKDQKRISSGSAPNSMFPICLEAQIFLPGPRIKSGSIEADDSPVDGWEYDSMNKAIKGLQSWIRTVKAGDAEDDIGFLEGILDMLQLCKQHDLLFTIGL